MSKRGKRKLRHLLSSDELKEIKARKRQENLSFAFFDVKFGYCYALGAHPLAIRCCDRDEALDLQLLNLTQKCVVEIEGEYAAFLPSDEAEQPTCTLIMYAYRYTDDGQRTKESYDESECASLFEALETGQEQSYNDENFEESEIRIDGKPVAHLIVDHHGESIWCTPKLYKLWIKDSEEHS